jgi:Tol biopolymer transport system component
MTAQARSACVSSWPLIGARRSAVLLVVICALALGAPRSYAGIITRVSVPSGGGQANGSCSGPSISADGRYVAFYSAADNLVAGDTNENSDVFVHDRRTGQTMRVSVATGGAQADSASSRPVISGDGRYVAFESDATNLVPGDTNGVSDIFVHDRATGETKRVSVSTGGVEGNGPSWGPALSADGRYVAFWSEADNLVPGDTNGCGDVFVHDCVTGQTVRVSVASSGAQANALSDWPSLSADGRYVAFRSFADNLVPNDTNAQADIFVHDLRTGQTTRVSVATGGLQANHASWLGCLSPDGRYVGFVSLADNLVPGDTNRVADVFVHDCVTGETKRVSVATNGAQANADSSAPSLSRDGRYVAFYSRASNLAAGDTNGDWDLFIHDTATGETLRVETRGWPGPGDPARLSADGRCLAFSSAADNLVPGDTNGVEDIFVYDRAGLPGDMNRDGQVDRSDFAGWAAAWKAKHTGKDWDRAADMNGDGDLTIQDAMLFVEALLTSSP